MKIFQESLKTELNSVCQKWKPRKMDLQKEVAIYEDFF